jgi:uncharacterized repeat protein (TIGR01451 family)
MRHRSLAFALGLLTTTIVIVGLTPPAFSSASRVAPAMTARKPSGLTGQGMQAAHKQGLSSHSVAMAPQSNLKLLEKATKLGPHAQQSRIKLMLALKLRHEAKLKSFLEQVQNPASPEYHQWLTPAEFTHRYGPTKTDVARVVSFLKARGIKVTDVSSNRTLIHTKATTASYEHAFGLHVNDYARHGRRFYSTEDTPKLPRTLAPLVANILGLNNAVRMRPESLHMQPLASARGLGPRQAPPASLKRLNPLQIAHAYDYPSITNSANASGVNIAILTATSSGLASLSDPHDFWAAFGLPDHSINVIPVGGDNGVRRGMGETLLDVEYSGAMGPGATLNVYVAADPRLATFTSMYNKFANDTNADGTAKNQVMTTSWGSPETIGGKADEANEQIFEQAAAEGISMFAAAGDNGSSDGTNQKNIADYPSSSIYVAAANGTQLNISDLDGAYGSEVVWNDASCFGGAPGATGGAISQLFTKPGWQKGPGVPADIDMRMNSGLAATASCSEPMLVIENGQWILTAGTSAVAPQLAGIFAMAVHRRASPLGQSNKLIYSDANANYETDFHDVTDGNNGAFKAAGHWDHPTGWGSPNVRKLLSHIGIQGPKGTLKGKITDSASGAPIGGAEVVATAADGKAYTTRSADDGSYSRVLPTGRFAVSVSAYSYTNGKASPTIGDGERTTHDFKLMTAPKATLSGKVTDGAGHGYPIYADIKLSTVDYGQVAEVWTTPATGDYSVKLPKNATYHISVAAAFDGYKTVSKKLKLSGDRTRNFKLHVTTACAAPGYGFKSGGFSEDFNGKAFPPTGWTVVPAQSTVTWMPDSQEPSDNDNYTGGTGDAAAADSAVWNQAGKPFDTSLVSPAIPVSSLGGSNVLRYKANYQHSLADAFDLDISTDGGSTWITLLHWAKSHGTFGRAPGAAVRKNLAPYLPKSGTFKLRWRYYDVSGGWDLYAQIDDVVIGGCAPVAGGIVTGHVTDANTGEGVVGARISVDGNDEVKTVANPADSELPAGTYLFFAPEGEHSLSVTRGNYTAANAGIKVDDSQVVQQDLALKAPQFTFDPASLKLHVMAGSSKTVSFKLSNAGNGAGSFTLYPIDAPPPSTSADAVPLKLVPVKHSTWASKSTFWIRRHTAAHDPKPFYTLSRGASTLSSGSRWLDLPDLPVKAGDNAAAYDASTGKIYSISGSNETNSVIGAAYAFDPARNTWQAIASPPTAREGGVAGFINGKLYLAAGVGPSGGVTETDVYDPVEDAWSVTAAPIPVPVSGAASAVLNGKLYVIGGLKIDHRAGVPGDIVQVYDPAAETWSKAVNYPGVVTFGACAAIKGKIYCAGGGGARGNRADGYAYDPMSNSWSEIADIPISGGVLGPIPAAANGKLLLAGGYINDGGLFITNQAEAYDPTSDSWTALPNLNHPVGRGGGTCALDGFYTFGSTFLAGSNLTFSAEAQALPGYACAGSGIAWATASPVKDSLAPGKSARVQITFDGSAQKEFTKTRAYLKVGGSPYGDVLPLTVTWDPRPVDLVVMGHASGPSVRKGDSLTYTLTVKNAGQDGHGAATESKLIYDLPPGMTYIASSGDGRCATDDKNSSVTCDLGTIGKGASNTLTIAVKADKAGTLTSHFEVAAREPVDSSKKAVEVNTTVIGSADVGITDISEATINEGDTGQVHISLANTGPDTATHVVLDASVEGGGTIKRASSRSGRCKTVDSTISCDLGDVTSGEKMQMDIAVLGTSGGVATVQGHVTTDSDDPNRKNNVGSGVVKVVKVAAEPPGDSSGGGGGAAGWFALVVLSGIGVYGAALRRRRNRSMS